MHFSGFPSLPIIFLERLRVRQHKRRGAQPLPNSDTPEKDWEEEMQDWEEEDTCRGSTSKDWKTKQATAEEKAPKEKDPTTLFTGAPASKTVPLVTAGKGGREENLESIGLTAE